MYLGGRSDDHGKCWPERKTIASDLESSHSTVKMVLNELIASEYLSKEKRYRNDSSTSNLYTVHQKNTVSPVKERLCFFDEPRVKSLWPVQKDSLYLRFSTENRNNPIQTRSILRNSFIKHYC